MQKVKSVFPNGRAEKTDLISGIKVKYNNLENQSAPYIRIQGGNRGVCCHN